MITLKDLGVLPPYKLIDCSLSMLADNDSADGYNEAITELAELDLTSALKKAGYVKLEDEMLTGKILKRREIKSEYQQVGIIVARLAIRELIIDNLKSQLKAVE